MKIYKVFLSENYQYFSADSLGALEKLQAHDYSELQKFSLTKKVDGRELLGDITAIDSTLLLLFSKKAKNIFCNCGEFLKINSLADFELFAPQILDALDYEKSEIDYFSNSTRLKRVRKYVFKEKALQNVDAFSLPINSSPVFVSRHFVEEYVRNGFQGLDFICVYGE